MMHDSVTNPSQSTNYYSPDDIPSSNHSKSQVNLGAGPREMLPSATSRRTQATLPNAGRWRINSSGQLVDAASSEWDLEDEMVKLQITDGSGDPTSQMHTPPQSKPNAANIVAPHETSPLETSSETSVGSTSPSNLDQHGNFASHSRGSSADTTGSATSQTLRPAPFAPLKIAAVGESRNRPHSYSGGISAADLSRLQQAGGSPSTRDTWSSPNGTPERPSQADPPAYASLASQNGFRPQDPTQMISSTVGDDLQVNYQLQQRRFAPMAQAGGQAPQFPPGNRPANLMANQPFRQARGFNPQVQLSNVVPSPTNFAYPPTIHPAPLNLTNAQQQIYDMMLPTPPLENPAMARLQQQTAFRPGHQHSASDPASLRDPATLAMINNSMQAFAAGQMYPPTIAPPPALSMFANQFYGTPPDNYPAELAMMARLQAQYTGGPYGMPVPGQAMSMPTAAGATTGGNSPGNGPSANNRKLGLYKTELCRSWEEKGTCRYGSKCQFAHGEDELRKVQRHPKYKTEICRTFWVSGSCPYGKRCCFIHTELPASGAPPGAEGAPPPANPDGRARSASTNSDPNEVSTSLLARISAKRSQEGTLNSGSGSVSTTPPSATFSGRPGALRVDTSVIDTANTKQNKSAYPTFAHNGVLMPAGEDAPSMSPGPVTAAPDFGRHTNARIDIVGTQPRISKTTNANSSGRHSLSGSDVQLDFNNSVTPTAAQSQSSQFTSSPPEPSRVGRINGHVRSGSAGNWGAATRTSHLTAYPLSSIPAGELKASSPWGDYVGSRIAEKTWG